MIHKIYFIIQHMLYMRTLYHNITITDDYVLIKSFYEVSTKTFIFKIPYKTDTVNMYESKLFTCNVSNNWD